MAVQERKEQYSEMVAKGNIKNSNSDLYDLTQKYILLNFWTVLILIKVEQLNITTILTLCQLDTPKYT